MVVVAVVDACIVGEELLARHWRVVRGRRRLGVDTVHLGLLNEHAVPGGTEHTLDADLVLDVAGLGEEPVAALTLFAGLGMPAFEGLDFFVVVLLNETLIRTVLRGVVNFFELE